MGLEAIRRGRRLAVLAVDPSSHRSKGSILGDKTRMPRLAALGAERCFIRPSPSGNHAGGLNRAAADAVDVLEASAFKYDLVMIEVCRTNPSPLSLVLSFSRSDDDDVRRKQKDRETERQRDRETEERERDDVRMIFTRGRENGRHRGSLHMMMTILL